MTDTTENAVDPINDRRGDVQMHRHSEADQKGWDDLADSLFGPEEDERAEGDGAEVEAKVDEEVSAETEEGEADENDDQESEDEAEKPNAELQKYLQENENIKRALRQEREARKQSDERLQGITQLIESLKASRQQKAEVKEEPKPQIPSLEEDPIGHFNYRLEQVQQEIAKRDAIIEELKTGSQKTVEQIESERQERQFWASVQASEQHIRQLVPSVEVDGRMVSDYDLACQHLESARIAELELMLPDDSPRAQAIAQRDGFNSVSDLRAAMLNQDRILVAQQATQLGQSPAQLYYNLAKQRGYVPATVKAKQADPATEKKGNGKQAIEATKRGQKAATTLSGGTGKSGADNPLSVEDLSELFAEDPDEFDRQWERMKKAGKLG